MERFVWIKRIIILLFFLGVFILYIHNLTRDIYSGDIGDLITAACVHGVAHPPGYPLFTLLGGMLCELPLPLPPVSRVGLISVFASVAGLIFYYKLAFRITKSLFLSLLSTSILAFSYLFWLHAEIPEVFGFNNFFIIIILYLAILFYQEKKDKYLYLLAFFTGLSLTHHHTILFVLPAAFFLVVKHIKYIFEKKTRIVYSVLIFILGLLPYLYIPIAASKEPVINWGQASNLQNFIDLILRKDYGGFSPIVVDRVPLVVKLILIKDYFRTLVSTYSYQIIFVFVLGILAMFRFSKLTLFSLLFVFLFSGVGFIFYGANPYSTPTAIGIVERFYTVSFVVFVFFIPYGFLFIKEILNHFFSRKIYSLLLLSYFLIIPFFLIKYNYAKTDLSQTHIGNNLAIDILSNLPKNSVLFVSGDTIVFNVWYLNFVLGYRKDVDIINPERVGANKYLEEEMAKYKKKHPETKQNEISGKTLDEIAKKRTVFSTYEIGYNPSNTMLLPKGLVFEIIHKDDAPSKEKYLKEVEEILRKLQRPRRESLAQADRNVIAPEVPLFYSNALVRIGDFLDSYYKDSQKAEHYYRRALWLDNQNPAAYSGLALVQYKAFHDCNESLNNMQKAIDIYPVWNRYYLQMFLIYQGCDADKKIIEKFKKHYESTFKSNLEDDMELFLHTTTK